MDWLKSKFINESAIPIPCLTTTHQKLPWVKELYNENKDEKFENSFVNRVLICKSPISSIPGVPEHTDLYFYQKGWSRPDVQTLYASYHGRETRIDLSKVKAKDVNIDYYSQCDKISLLKPDIRICKVIDKALALSEENYD